MHGQNKSDDMHSMHGAASTLVDLAQTTDHVKVAVEHATKPELATEGGCCAASVVYALCSCVLHGICKATCKLQHTYNAKTLVISDCLCYRLLIRCCDSAISFDCEMEEHVLWEFSNTCKDA